MCKKGAPNMDYTIDSNVIHIQVGSIHVLGDDHYLMSFTSRIHGCTQIPNTIKSLFMFLKPQAHTEKTRENTKQSTTNNVFRLRDQGRTRD